MYRIRIIVVDRTRRSFLKEGEEFYKDRLRKYARLEWVVVRPGKMTKNKIEREVLQEEGRRIVQKLFPRDHLVVLDPQGEEYDSVGLARWLGKVGPETGGAVCFVMGGPLGLSREIREKARAVLSFSKLTLTHEMIRLLLLEQLYRAFTILHGEKYHK
jgi:23S rRNA (pseudouridine1915-N3)-methyltransferase